MNSATMICLITTLFKTQAKECKRHVNNFQLFDDN